VTVKINLWALEKYVPDFNAERARLWIKGQVTNAENGDVRKFNDAGELITILGKWNTAKFKQLRDSAQHEAASERQRKAAYKAWRTIRRRKGG
jgi:hypothetical protein